MILLNAVLSLVLGFLLSPYTLLAAILVGVLAVLALVVKLAWAIVLWGEFLAAVKVAWTDLKSDPIGFGVLLAVFLIFPNFGAIGALAYVVARKLNIVVNKV